MKPSCFLVRVVAPVLLAGTLLSGCGGPGSEPSGTPTRSGSPTTDATGTPSESPSANASGSPSATAAPSATDPVRVVGLKMGWPAAGDRNGADVTRLRLEDRQLIATGCRQQLQVTDQSFTGRALEFLGPQEARKRQVARFLDRTAAQAAIAGVVAEARSCPTRDQDGATAITEVERRQGSVVITTHYTYQDELIAGAASLVAVRRGRVVVLSSMANETAGEGGADVLAELDLPHARSILAQVCAAEQC